MKKRTISIAVIAIALVATYALVDTLIEPPPSRSPASVPNNYEQLSACDKQQYLWSKIEETKYKELPELRKFGPLQLFAMSRQMVSTKGSNHSDFAPEGWQKFIHGRASIAKVKVVPDPNSKYTGVYQGAECALLRLSLTFKPVGGRSVAPGLALKVLRDGFESANISALVSLDGQKQNFDFFQNAMSNIVPLSNDMGAKMVHQIFSSASHFPEELSASYLAEADAHGITVKNVVAPRQLFFIPNPNLKFPTELHENRRDFMSIPAGTTIYQIFAAPDKYNDFDYVNDYKSSSVDSFKKESVHIADIITTSEFLSSEFGDDGIFFRHPLRPL